MKSKTRVFSSSFGPKAFRVSVDAVNMLLLYFGYPLRPPPFRPKLGRLHLGLTGKEEKDGVQPH